jgi:hypothetical protein
MSILTGKVRRFAGALVPQPQRPPRPGQGELPGTAQAEFVICDKSIEESFRDDKSGGFEMAHTRLQHADRLERLLLALAIATLWCHELGEHVLEQGDAARRTIDPGLTRQLSVFQLGLRWLKRCVSTNIGLLPAFLARLSPLKRLVIVGTRLS